MICEGERSDGSLCFQNGTGRTEVEHGSALKVLYPGDEGKLVPAQVERLETSPAKREKMSVKSRVLGRPARRTT